MVGESSQEIPQRVMDLLRIFLAANSRGEQAVLVLETRKGTLNTKYRNVESVAGVPVCSTSSNSAPKKVNQARARRSRLRLEQFIQRKVKNLQTAGDSVVEVSNHGVKKKVDTLESANKLVMEIVNEELPLQPSISPIDQLDGAAIEEKIAYSFRSEYGEEDIVYAMSEIFPESVIPNLVSRIRIEPRSAFHQCTVELDFKEPTQKLNFSWPALKPWHWDLFVDLTVK